MTIDNSYSLLKNTWVEGNNRYENENYEQLCTSGYYCPNDKEKKIPCPNGNYCPNSKEMKPCIGGYYCPTGSTNMTLCPIGN